MNIPVAAYITFGFLLCALVSLWVPWKPTGRLPLWAYPLTASLVSALITGILAPLGLLWILLCGLSAYGIKHKTGWLQRLAVVSFVCLSLALMTHQLPGFHKVKILDGVLMRPDAIPYTQYLNLDKAMVAIFSVAFLLPKSEEDHWSRSLRIGVLFGLGTVLFLLPNAIALDYLRFDPSFNANLPHWIVINLFLTIFAEEAFFRGFMQGSLARKWKKSILSLLVAALFFGLPHYRGGIYYVVLSSLAGLGYGLAYWKGRSLEAAMIAHFIVNLVHFTLFPYPALAQ